MNLNFNKFLTYEKLTSALEHGKVETATWDPLKEARAPISYGHATEQHLIAHVNHANRIEQYDVDDHFNVVQKAPARY